MLIVLDDVLETKRLIKISFLQGLLTRRRHLNTSTMICTQSYMKLDDTLRLNATSPIWFQHKQYRRSSVYRLNWYEIWLWIRSLHFVMSCIERDSSFWFWELDLVPLIFIRNAFELKSTVLNPSSTWLFMEVVDRSLVLEIQQRRISQNCLSYPRLYYNELLFGEKMCGDYLTLNFFAFQ